MANQLKMAIVESIITLYERGWSKRQIARELGLNRETVARHLRQAVESKPASAHFDSPAPGKGSKPAIAPIGSGNPEAESKPANAPIGSKGSKTET
jgi:DNA-binding transcriptional MocR family regulator